MILGGCCLLSSVLHILDLSYLIITTIGKVRDIIYIHLQILNWYLQNLTNLLTGIPGGSTGPDFKSKTSYSRTSVLNLFWTLKEFQKAITSFHAFTWINLGMSSSCENTISVSATASSSPTIPLPWLRWFPTPTLPSLYSLQAKSWGKTHESTWEKKRGKMR